MSPRTTALGALSLLLFTAAAACGSSTDAASTTAGTTAASSAGGSGGAGGAPSEGGSGGAVPEQPQPTGDPLSWPVDAAGPFKVGYRSWKITYSPKGISEPRTIGFNVWYPTNALEGPSPVYVKLFSDPDVFTDAPLAPSPFADGKYPVHVYSHGSSGFGGTSSDMMHWFASHGWVAIAPDHTGNTLGLSEGAHPLSLYFLRSTDVSRSIDELDALPKGDPLAGKARTDKVFMSGHSFGTLTTWASGGATFDVEAIQAKCKDPNAFAAPCTDAEIAIFKDGVSDPRIVAGLPMAGSASDWFTTDGYDAVKKPYMLLTGTEDVTGQGVFDRVKSIDFTWLEFKGGCHQLFALGGCPNFDTEEGFRLVNTYAFAFARKHLLADGSDTTAHLLDGTKAVSDKVVYHHHAAP